MRVEGIIVQVASFSFSTHPSLLLSYLMYVLSFLCPLAFRRRRPPSVFRPSFVVFVG